MSDPTPTPFPPPGRADREPARAPWYRCLFRRWDEPEFIQMSDFYTDYSKCGRREWKGSIYRQCDRRIGRYRYFVRGQYGDQSIDAGAFESSGTVVFT